MGGSGHDQGKKTLARMGLNSGKFQFQIDLSLDASHTFLMHVGNDSMVFVNLM
jgi:hypothetical protein